MRLVLTALFVGLASAAGAHPCDANAIEKATSLLKFHFESDDIEMMTIDPTVKTLNPIKALKGTGKFDVLEVWGHISKADYRMHFIYAHVADSCLLMGQEILEASDPY